MSIMFLSPINIKGVDLDRIIKVNKNIIEFRNINKIRRKNK